MKMPPSPGWQQGRRTRGFDQHRRPPPGTKPHNPAKIKADVTAARQAA